MEKIEKNPLLAEYDRIEFKKYYPEEYFKRAGYKYDAISKASNNKGNKENASKKSTASIVAKSRNKYLARDFVRFNEDLDST